MLPKYLLFGMVFWILPIMGFVPMTMNHHHKEFIQFKDRFQKRYTTLQKEQDSYLTFCKNLEIIKSLNQHSSSYSMGINSFADQPIENIRRELLSSNFSNFNPHSISEFSQVTRSPHKIAQLTSSSLGSDDDCTKQLDWYKSGYVRPVKDQGKCGSCWAFSAVGALESMVHLNTGHRVLLSEQELVDCSSENFGCKGGWMHKAFDYVQNQEGLYLNADYPYVGIEGQCRVLPEEKTRILDSGRFHYGFIKPNSISALKKGLFLNPVCVAVDADDYGFLFYKEGIYDKPVVENPRINHAVLLIGLDEDKKTWRIKNSWGKGWGNNGFMELAIRPGSGVAGIQTYGVIPVFQNVSL